MTKNFNPALVKNQKKLLVTRVFDVKAGKAMYLCQNYLRVPTLCQLLSSKQEKEEKALLEISQLSPKI